MFLRNQKCKSLNFSESLYNFAIKFKILLVEPHPFIHLSVNPLPTKINLHCLHINTLLFTLYNEYSNQIVI